MKFDQSIDLRVLIGAKVRDTRRKSIIYINFLPTYNIHISSNISLDIDQNSFSLFVDIICIDFFSIFYG